jgi:hypothetical protein
LGYFRQPHTLTARSPPHRRHAARFTAETTARSDAVVIDGAGSIGTIRMTPGFAYKPFPEVDEADSG